MFLKPGTSEIAGYCPGLAPSLTTYLESFAYIRQDDLVLVNGGEREKEGAELRAHDLITECLLTPHDHAKQQRQDIFRPRDVVQLGFYFRRCN